MKLVAVVFADFVTANTGGPSQLRTRLRGQSILDRTLRRVALVRDVAARCVFVRPRDEPLAREAVAASASAEPFEVLPLDTAPHGRRALLSSARKWSIESWRGGLLGSTWLDEFIDPRAAALVLDHYRCDGLLCVDGHQPVFDPQIADAMIAHARANQHESKVTFTQAPPGLAGAIVRREALEDLLSVDIPLGLLLSYRPEMPQYDPIIHAACYHVPALVAQTPARLTGDTNRSREMLEAALAELGDDADAIQLCNWLNEPGHDRAGPLPVEVEIELTTDDPCPDSTLRPRGSRVPARSLDDLAALGARLAELGAYDDRLLVLGGHGDPLLHPQLGEVCAAARAAGIMGLAITTPLVTLDEAQLDAIFEHRVDVIEILLDAHTPETYRKVHGADHFGRVVTNVERIERRRQQAHSPQPIVVCSMTRCAATIGEMEAFYDRWIEATGSAVLRGYNDYAGALPPDTLLPTVPPVRERCRRLRTRLVFLADGTVPPCAQDFGGRLPLGDWRRSSLRDIWASDGLAELRRAHAVLELEDHPLCGGCAEWNRP